MACAIRTGPEMFLFKVKQKIKSSNYFSAMPDIEMNPLLFKAFSHPTTSHEETSFQRIQPYASLRKAKPPVPPRLGTDPLKRRFGKTIQNRCIRCLLLMMLRLSEPRLEILDGCFETCPEKFFEPKETRSQFCTIFAFL